MPPSAPTPPEKRSWPRRLLNRLEVDRATFYAIASRGWQFFAGPVTILLIANYFSPVIQGYYYTFWSLIALQTFFELGFYVVIVNVASHEWQKLQRAADGSIVGDAAALSRLVSLGRLTIVWYTVAGGLFVAGVGCGGLAFFALSDRLIEGLQAPWWTLVALSGGTLASMPFLGILEGCNQVTAVYRMQLVRAVLGNLAVWICIPLGGGLWTPVAATVVKLACEGYLFAVTYRRFFAVFLRSPAGPRMNWWTEVWPMQWRLALKGVLNSFSSQLLNPVIFHYHGPVAAGQMGMTWNILTSLQAACAAWFKTRAPRFGILVAARDYRELDRVFFRVTGIAMGILTLACLAFWFLDLALYATWPSLAARLLPPGTIALLVVVQILGLIPDAQWTYIHAHKQSPHMLLSAISAIVAALWIWWWGAWYGPLGMGFAMLAILCGFVLPVWTWAWLRCRAEWHQVPPSSAA